MHRAGTSVTTHLLNAFGVPLSDDLLEPTDQNVKGHFESRWILNVHERILESMGMDWKTSNLVLPFAKNWWRAPQVQQLKRELAEIVQREMEGHNGLWGFKDPRTARLLPLWLELIEELGLDPRFLLVTRNPADVAKSLFSRDQIDPVYAEILWLEHNADAVLGLRPKLDGIVEYSRWMSDPVEQAQYMLERLHLDWKGTPEEIKRITDQVISPDLRHHDGVLSSFNLPLTEPFYRALLSRDLDALCTLSKTFDIARGLTQIALTHLTAELRAKVIDQLAPIIQARGERIIDLEAQLARRDN